MAASPTAQDVHYHLLLDGSLPSSLIPVRCPGHLQPPIGSATRSGSPSSGGLRALLTGSAGRFYAVGAMSRTRSGVPLQVTGATTATRCGSPSSGGLRALLTVFWRPEGFLPTTCTPSGHSAGEKARDHAPDEHTRAGPDLLPAVNLQVDAAPPLRWEAAGARRR